MIPTVQSSTCPTPGQIRLDAVVEYSELVAGCNCACDPALYDMNSPRYCAEPNAVNFDPDTLQGDCSCGCDMFGGTRPSDCVFPTQWDGSICDCACPVWAPGLSFSFPYTFHLLLCFELALNLKVRMSAIATL